MDDFLILLQAGLDEAASKGKINEDIRTKLQGKIDDLKLHTSIDENSIKAITDQMSKLGIQIGQDFGKAFNNGLSNTINKNVLSQINKISDSSTSTVVQNEKKKQEAYKATSDAVVYHAGVISKLNKAETNGRFYGSNRGTGYFGTGHYFVDSATKHELDNNSSYSKLPYTSVDISQYDNLFRANNDKIAGKLHDFLENITKFTQGSDRFNIDELFSQFKDVFTDTTMDIKDFGYKMEQLKTFMSNSDLSDRRDSVSTQFMKSLGYGGVDTRGTKYADTRYGTVIYDLKEESVLQANITDELQKQGQMLEKINYEKGQVFDSSTDAKIQEQIDAQKRVAEVQAEFHNIFDNTELDKTDSELSKIQNRLSEINTIISNCESSIESLEEDKRRFAKEMEDFDLFMSEEEIQEDIKNSRKDYQDRIEELSLERVELEKRIPVLEENREKEYQLANEAYKQAEQIVEQRRLESQQSSSTANEVIQNEEKKQQATQESIKLQSELVSFNAKFKETGIATINEDGVVDMKKSLEEVRNIYSDFGKVTIKNEMSDLVKGTEQFRVSIESSNGELKCTESFLMKLSEDGKSFVFADDMIRSSESTVRHLNEQQEAANKVILEEEKLANAMGDVHEKSDQIRQAEEKRQQLAQNKVINKALEDEYKQKQKLTDQVNEIQLLSNGGIKNDYSTQIAKIEGNFRSLGFTEDEIQKKTSNVTSTFNALKTRVNQPFDESNYREIISLNDKLQKELIESSNEYTRLQSSAKGYASIQQRLSKANTIEAWNQKNSAATKEVISNNEAYIASLRDLNTQMTKMQFNEISDEFKKTENSMRSLGRLGASFREQMSQAAQSFTQWLSVSSAVMLIISKTRNAISDLKEVNTLLTEISKANEKLTKSDLVQIGNDSFDIASKYGKTATDYLAGVQEASRAGYENAMGIAELSVAAQGAGDMTAELANQYIIATDKAYKLGGSVEKLTEVLDGSNYITNHNAVNMTELAEGMSIVGSQAASLGVKVNETTAVLGTMIATTQQSGSEMARAFKAILLNLQQVTDEEEGIDAEGLTKYEEACKALNVSLKETKDGITSLRDPMEVLKDLASEYSKLDSNDIRRTNLLSSVGGKLRANALNAILENYDMYEKMLQEYANGVGSMAAEAEKTANSWEGSLNRLSNTWTDTVENVANSDAIITIINGLNDLLSVVNNVTDKLGSLGTIGLGAGLFAGIKNVGKPKMFGFNYCFFEYADSMLVLLDTVV